MRLAICMIVKNYEAHLERCLESVKGIGDIYILDTGSTDKTVEIAKKYTDKVFEDYKWNDNFAEARNHILNKADTDWVLSIDADEYLEDGLNHHDVLHDLVDKADAAGMNTISLTLKAERTEATHYFPRLFKKASVHWVGAIHNHLSVVEENTCDLVIVYGYSEAHKKDPDRAIRILSKEVALTGKVREKYYLAREYWYLKDYHTAIHWYTEYLKVGYWGPEKADANLMIARCFYCLKDYKLARKYCMEAININADFAEALHFMGGLTGPNSSARWYQYADLATNKNVLWKKDLRNEREKQLDNCIPDLYKYKSVLYVGANTHRCHILPTFRNRGYKIDIVEPFEKNCKYYKGVIGINEVHHSTIKDFKPKGTYDVVFWWHGPEHIDKNELEAAMKHMEWMANKLVVLGVPWGINKQEAIDDNNFEIHRASMFEKDFTQYGYKTNTIGKINTCNGNLIAWKQMGE